jgi:ribosomal-protein-alanine N-acetyltransferase
VTDLGTPTVRAAKPSDLEPVTALDADLFGADAWSPTAMAAELGAEESRFVVVAMSGTALTGYAILLTLGEVADVQRIGVAREAQRSGVGSMLLNVLVASAVGSGCARMLLEVSAENLSASAFYHRHGFSEVARRPGYYSGGAAAVVMARDLSRRTGT